MEILDKDQPIGLSHAPRAEAERLWQRGVTLIDSNQRREAIPPGFSQTARFARLADLGRYLKKLSDIENAKLAAPVRGRRHPVPGR